jgi:pimeloyl-ACP methyl ester carboxylesterase
MSVFTSVLATHWRTIAPDLRGYGRSRVSQSFTMEEHLDDLAALLAQTTQEPAVILGWSLGGILAMELALRLPQRVRGLIIVASAGGPRSDHPPVTWEETLWTGVASVINWVAPGWRWNIETFGRRSLYRYLIQTHEPQTYQYLANYAFPAFLQTSPQAQSALEQAIRQGYDRTPDLHRITCPTLILAGQCDRHIIPAASEATATAIPNADWICYPQTGHLFPWEIPDQINADIQDWLRTCLKS